MLIPSLFIGSSKEGLRVAEEIRNNLEKRRNCNETKVVTLKIWKEGIFRLGDFVPDRLIEVAAAVDFAVLVFSPDDIVLLPGTTSSSSSGSLRDSWAVIARSLWSTMPRNPSFLRISQV
jgi:predicted nucleotide-binding protein